MVGVRIVLLKVLSIFNQVNAFRTIFYIFLTSLLLVIIPIFRSCMICAMTLICLLKRICNLCARQTPHPQPRRTHPLQTINCSIRSDRPLDFSQFRRIEQ